MVPRVDDPDTVIELAGDAGADAAASGVVVVGGRVLVIGRTTDAAGVSSPLVWGSDDGGRSFAPAVSIGGLTSGYPIGVARNGDEIWVGSCEGGRTTLAVSDDLGESFELVVLDPTGVHSVSEICGAGPVAEDGRLYVGLTIDWRPAVAEVGRDGIVAVQAPISNPRQDLIGPPIVLSARDRVFVTPDLNGFEVQIGDRGGDGPPVRPYVNNLGLDVNGEFVTLSVSRAPYFGGSRDDGTLTWSSRQSFAVRGDDGEWSGGGDEAVDGIIVGPNGSALSWSWYVDDPFDDPAAMAAGGTSVALRAPDGSWGAPVLVGSGPGEELGSVVRVDGGWMMVVTSRRWSEDGETVLTEPIATETQWFSADGVTWNDVTGDVQVGGVRVSCSLPNGAVVVAGWSNDGRRLPGLALIVDGVVRERPADVVDVEVSDCSATDDGVVITGTRDGRFGAWTSADGSSFVPIALPRSVDDSELAFVTRIEELTIVLERHRGRSPIRFWVEDGNVSWSEASLEPGSIPPLGLISDIALVNGEIVLVNLVDGLFTETVIRVQRG